MILQYFKKKENEYEDIAEKIYITILSQSKTLIKKNYFKKIDFDSSFELISILLIFYLKNLKNTKEKKYNLIKDFLIQLFIRDLDKSMREIGIGDISLGKYVKKYVNKFYYRVKKIDSIFDSYDELLLLEYLNSLKNIDAKYAKSLANELLTIYKKIKKNKENL